MNSVFDMGDYRNKRAKLVESLAAKGIKDKAVLNAIANIPRELFLQEDIKPHAYEDKALPIDCGQTISQPYTVAYMTSLLDLSPGDKVLEIGTGSGYQALILSFIGAEVYSIERIKELADEASRMFNLFKLKVNQKLGDGSIGWEEKAPFDRIIITAGAPDIPQKIAKQLKVGGKMVVPVGRRETQEMVLLKRKGENQFTYQKWNKFKFVPLIGELGWKY